LPTDWNELPEETLLIFPAADPQAFFSLSLYLSLGGTLQDSQGRFVIDETTMSEVLSFYLPSSQVEFFTRSVINYETDELAWNAFREQRGNLVVTWAARFLGEQPLALTLAPLPGLEAGQYSLATGWSWALAGSNPENQPLAVELAEFLSDSQFLGEWSQAAGYLPTRPTALAAWEDAQSMLGLAQTAESASLVPSQELLTAVGPLVAEATLAVINEELLPAEAAQLIAEQLK
jgi:ABC-type glycerol-3-phosphate transport system substrate-binding protein